MSDRRLLVLALASFAVAATTLTVSSNAADNQLRGHVDAQFTTEQPGTSSGRTEYGQFYDPANPSGKPHSVSRVVLQLADGATFDTAAIPQCTVSDAELMADGPSACPGSTKVGAGPFVVDTGFDGPSRYVNFDVTAFNAKDGLIILAREQGSGAYIVIRGTISGGRLQIDFPPAPGAPPDGGALKSEHILFAERMGIRDGKPAPYLRTPPSCPVSGQWVNRLTYTFGDGVTQTFESSSPCTAEAGTAGERASAMRVIVHGLPSRCTRRDFRLVIRVRGGGSLRDLTLYLDHRRIERSRHRRQVVRVPASRLHEGKHLLRVVARDRAGQRISREASFKRCG